MLFIYHPDQTDETNKKTKERKKSKTPSNQTTFEIDDKKDDENLWCKHSNKSNNERRTKECFKASETLKNRWRCKENEEEDEQYSNGFVKEEREKKMGIYRKKRSVLDKAL